MIKRNITLKEAADSLNGATLPGVYVMYLYGQIMKVGKAEIGIQKRMQQYYGLNSYCGLNSHINQSNRDSIRISFQTCNVTDCNELESKLFDKYGKISSLPWASRRPHCSTDNCKLLI
jgi:hypothetical protein